jgi:hypothetical protein
MDIKCHHVQIAREQHTSLPNLKEYMLGAIMGDVVPWHFKLQA